MLNETKVLRVLPMLTKYFSLLLFTLFYAIQTKAVYFEYTPKLKEIQGHIASLRLKKANAFLVEELAKQPDNLAVNYLIHYSKFYKVMVQQDKTLLPDFEKYNSEFLLGIQKLSD